MTPPEVQIFQKSWSFSLESCDARAGLARLSSFRRWARWCATSPSQPQTFQPTPLPAFLHGLSEHSPQSAASVATSLAWIAKRIKIELHLTHATVLH
eukprot:3922316-Amphidinium_carterae.1